MNIAQHIIMEAVDLFAGNRIDTQEKISQVEAEIESKYRKMNGRVKWGNSQNISNGKNGNGKKP